MLRYFFIFLGLTCLLNSVYAENAKDSGFFIQLGGSFYKSNQGNKLTQAFRQNAINAIQTNPEFLLSGSNSNSSSTSIIPTLGYQLNRFFSVQLGFQQFNNQTQQANVTAHIIPEDFVVTNNASIQSSAYYLTGKFQHAIDQANLKLFAEAGLAHFNQTINESSTGTTVFVAQNTSIPRWNTSQTFKSSFTSPIIGLGIQYAMPSLQQMGIFIKWRHIFALNKMVNYPDPTAAVGGVVVPTGQIVSVKELQSIDMVNMGVQYLF
jgi:hypothetical protein